jgi:hypothetical protein
VGDVIYTGPEEDRWPVAYYSLRERRFGSTAMVKTAGNPNDVVRLIQDELFALDLTVAMSDINSDPGEWLLTRLRIVSENRGCESRWERKADGS